MKQTRQTQTSDHWPPYKNNTHSGVRGVYWDCETGKWEALIRRWGRLCHLGRWSTIAEAEKVWIKAKKQYMRECGK